MHCRLCRNKQVEFKFKVKGHTLYQCSSCRYIQVMEKPSWQELEAIYTKSYFSHNKYRDTFTQEKENKRRLNLLRRFLPGEGCKILDFGCAAGDFIRYACPHYDMWGHDFSENAMEKAGEDNSQIRHRLSSGLLTKNHFAPSSFDGITMWDVPEHLWDPLAVFKQLLDYLKPGGFLFLSTPDIGTFTAKTMGKYWAFMTPPEHLGFFSRRSISYLLEKELNCEILDRRSIGKWVNIGFIFYKIKRIFPRLVPAVLLRLFQLKYTKNLALYVPTGDIGYITARK